MTLAAAKISSSIHAQTFEDDAFDRPRGALLVHTVEGLLRLVVEAHFAEFALHLLVLGVVAVRGHLLAAFEFEPLAPFLPLFHIERLPGHKRMRGLYQRREYAVQTSQHERREEQDADTDGEGPHQGKEVDGFGLGQRLPNAVGDVEQCPDPCDGHCDLRHRVTQRHHVVVKHPENRMQVLREGKHAYHTTSSVVRRFRTMRVHPPCLASGRPAAGIWRCSCACSSVPDRGGAAAHRRRAAPRRCGPYPSGTCP